MEVTFSSSFRKSMKKKIRINPLLENDFWICLELFVSDPFHPSLKTHKLSGKLKPLWSFSIDYSHRVVFYFTESKPVKAVLVDIGTHEEVY